MKRPNDSRSRWTSFGALLALVAGASCGPQNEPVPPSKSTVLRPNLLFISIDTLRADALSCYGNELPTSPNVDSLAQNGVLFEQATSTTSWTLPAHISMLTGLNISAHGICDERLWGAVGLPGGPPQLPLRGEYISEPLLRAGYRTAGYFTWEYLDADFGFGQGFEEWTRVGNTVWSDAALKAKYKELVKANKVAELKEWASLSPEQFDYQAPTTDAVVDRGLAWLDTVEGEPFFLFLHLFDVHDEYLAPEPFATQFDPLYTGPVDGTEVSSDKSQVNHEMPARDLENLRARYLGEVAWVDSQIGRLLSELERRGLRENTLIVLTSDHGEEFFEHGHKTHRSQLYPETVHVPLIFSWPGHLDVGRRVKSPAGIVDIAPTISSLLNVAPPSSVSGRDLSAVLHGAEEQALAPYLTELQLFQSGNPVPVRHTGIRLGDELWLRVVQRDGSRSGEYFDLTKNPVASGFGAPLDGDAFAHFDDLLGGLRAKTQAERDLAPSRANLYTRLGNEVSEELSGMGYLESRDGTPVSTTIKLCMDGCFASPPAK